MSFDWSEYLLVAQELVSQTTASSKAQRQINLVLIKVIERIYNISFKKVRKRSLDEAKLRCAISRAYYAAFRMARNHLRDKDGLPLNVLLQGNTHQNVINHFNRSSDLDRQMIAQFLRDLRSARNKADYDDTVPNLAGLTMTVLLQSEQVLDLLKTL
ncbi:MAG TPA: hypothetical protein VFA09_10145 [Ktedonobacteraceae bacterium]|nr:hypothetical protein [Ktedonobacteraceae bacterium]